MAKKTTKKQTPTTKAKSKERTVTIYNPAITKGESEMDVPESQLADWLSVGWTDKKPK